MQSMKRGIEGAVRSAAGARQLSRQTRQWSANYDSYTRHGSGAKQYGQGAPFFRGYWATGIHRSILERSGWVLFFFIPVEGAWLFYDFGYRRVDTEMGPWISDNYRYDGTEYDDVEKEVRYRWATDGTLCQHIREHGEVKAKEMMKSMAALRIEMKKERGQM
eukprot:TRINITY_DN42990_c0_g1_i1.p2 TRINITY_DN42990_c0_g1~~TRINITY_DN42990_c0_g1_i1.p2  ORF type:complete len:162 (+),score=45.97 TRINITY_DN42990_c0_g1_i1:42-527(+)